jgi:hypothetical protein
VADAGPCGMTVLAEVSTIYLDASGVPQPFPCGDDWHLVTVACRPAECVCPECWPSYQNHHFVARNRPASHHVSRVAARHASRYTCTICERSNA